MTRLSDIESAIVARTFIPWSRIINRCEYWREADLVKARTLAACCARRMTSMSFPEIAAWLKMRSHSAVVQMIRRGREMQDEIAAVCGTLGWKSTPKALVQWPMGARR